MCTELFTMKEFNAAFKLLHNKKSPGPDKVHTKLI